MSDQPDNNYEKNYKNFLKLKKENSSNYLDIFFEQNIKKHTDSFQVWKNDGKNNIYQKMDWVYQTQDLLAFKILLTLRSIEADLVKRSILEYNDILLDVGTRFNSASFFGSLFSNGLLYSEISGEVFLPSLSIKIIHAEAQNLPLGDNSIPFITSLHAIEHFGLGRYGDSIDYYGDVKGLKEMHRVLQPGGYIVTSVPCTSKKSKINFHEERIYNPSDYDLIMENIGFEKVKEKNILDSFGSCSRKELASQKMMRDSMGLYILSDAGGSFSWQIEDLAAAENHGCLNAAYLSLWRKT